MDPAVLTGLGALLTAGASVGGYLLAKRQFEANQKQQAQNSVESEKAAEYERMVQLMGQYVTTLDQYRKDVEYVRNQLSLEREECEERIEELKNHYEGKVEDLLAEVARISASSKKREAERNDD